MTQATSQTIIRCIRILTDHSVEVDRVEQFVRDDMVVATGNGSLQTIRPGDDISQFVLEPEVLNVLNAVWTQESFSDRATELVERATNALASARQMVTDASVQQKELEDRHAQILADVKKSGQAVLAAHAELDREHSTLAVRMDQITATRSELFAHAQDLRAKRADLSALIDPIVNSVPPQPTMPPKRPA